MGIAQVTSSIYANPAAQAASRGSSTAAAAATAGAAAVTAATSTGRSIFTKACTFFMGDWASPVGLQCHAARKAGTATLKSFAWKEAFNKYVETGASAATAQPAKKGIVAGIKSLISKLPGGKFLTRSLGGTIMLAQTALQVYNGYKRGGLPEAGKSLAKGCAGLGASAVVTAIAAALGAGGAVASLIGILAFVGVGMLADKIAPDCPDEKQAEELAKANENDNGVDSSGALDMSKNPEVKAVMDLVYDRNQRGYPSL